jgi:hypothetical protein
LTTPASTELQQTPGVSLGVIGAGVAPERESTPQERANARVVSPPARSQFTAVVLKSTASTRSGLRSVRPRRSSSPCRHVHSAHARIPAAATSPSARDAAPSMLARPVATGCRRKRAAVSTTLAAGQRSDVRSCLKNRSAAPAAGRDGACSRPSAITSSSTAETRICSGRRRSRLCAGRATQRNLRRLEDSGVRSTCSACSTPSKRGRRRKLYAEMKTVQPAWSELHRSSRSVVQEWRHEA